MWNAPSTSSTSAAVRQLPLAVGPATLAGPIDSRCAAGPDRRIEHRRHMRLTSSSASRVRAPGDVRAAFV